LEKGENTVKATRYFPFVGRLLIGLPFAMSGFSKLAAYGPTTEMISAIGLPAPITSDVQQSSPEHATT
jgi:uncharacterized membrane protein YphA (DoxX/SURF4 family)